MPKDHLEDCLTTYSQASEKARNASENSKWMKMYYLSQEPVKTWIRYGYATTHSHTVSSHRFVTVKPPWCNWKLSLSINVVHSIVTGYNIPIQWLETPIWQESRSKSKPRQVAYRGRVIWSQIQPIYPLSCLYISQYHHLFNVVLNLAAPINARHPAHGQCCC